MKCSVELSEYSRESCAVCGCGVVGGSSGVRVVGWGSWGAGGYFM